MVADVRRIRHDTPAVPQAVGRAEVHNLDAAQLGGHEPEFSEMLECIQVGLGTPIFLRKIPVGMDAAYRRSECTRADAHVVNRTAIARRISHHRASDPLWCPELALVAKLFALMPCRCPGSCHGGVVLLTHSLWEFHYSANSVATTTG